ncbi:hypothetical protein SmJEL517_g00206 [Synchytrium microbalum]|uniref:Disintegrin and metalloproteinase domain-containing protein B n=1 Tax=Synchytrium microbalum TaxID=1806994 RepID=A0A507CFB5_9FUNG|nr:uncharacterized protein SmJEL517_g00206 [Synchytrium microbalum]TPX38191.1 hypothetical protein SmJEL517_g00206 [Synchytrium microbalum]
MEAIDVVDTLKEAQSQYKTTQVSRPISYEHDAGNLTAFDNNALDDTILFGASSTDIEREKYLTSNARDALQSLLNEIFTLPTVKKNDATLVELPRPTTQLPRAKPVPREKIMTRWEKFAKAKGIKKVKKSTKVFDEAMGEWIPKFGYKHGTDKLDDWLVEVPETSDPMEDQYEKARTEKKDRVDKNNRRAKRNSEERSAEASGQDPRKIKKAQLETALKQTKTSTASLGKFDATLHNEDKVKLKSGIKRKYEPTSGDAEAERKKILAVAEKVIKAREEPVLNAKKAVSQVAQSRSRPTLEGDHKKSFKGKKTRGGRDSFKKGKSLSDLFKNLVYFATQQKRPTTSSIEVVSRTLGSMNGIWRPVLLLLLATSALLVQAADLTLLHRIRQYDFLSNIDATSGNSGTALQRTFKMVLQPNEMLIHSAGLVTIYSDNEPPQQISLAEFAGGRAFHGKVIEEDDMGILQEVGWARIIFHDDDLWMGRLDPDFEGVFTTSEGMFHIKHVDHYKMAKRPEDAPVIPMLDRPKSQQHSRLIIYADSQEGHVAATCPNTPFSPFTQGAQKGCGVEEDIYTSSGLDKRSAQSPEHSCGFDASIHKHEDFEVITKPSRLAERAASGCPSSRQMLGVGAAADCTYVAQYGGPSGALTQILADFNAASKVYENTFNISLAVVEVAIHTTCTPNNSSLLWNQACSDAYTINNRLSDFSHWRGQKSADQAGLWHLLTNCPSGPSVGIAWLSTVCETTFTSQATGGSTQYVSGAGVSSIVTTEWKVTLVPFMIAYQVNVRAQVAAHVVNVLDVIVKDNTVIMHPTDNSVLDAFSPCSQSTICGQYAKLGTCLRSPGSFSTVTAGVCGNGIKEGNEDCDCGANCATDSCCDGTTCKFKNSAKCDDLNDACCKGCQLLSNGTVCRASISVCDYAEQCDGISSSCPTDLHVSDGTSCDSTKGLTCASGICTSRDAQCKSNSTYFTTTGACPGYDSDCSLWCAAGSSGCLKGAGYFLDGTPCGYGGMCKSGSCSSSNVFYQVINWFSSNPTIAIPAAVLAGLVVFGVVIGVCTCCIRRWRRKGPAAMVPAGLMSQDSYAAPTYQYQAPAHYVDASRYNGSAYSTRDDFLVDSTYRSMSRAPLRSPPVQVQSPMSSSPSRSPISQPATPSSARPMMPQAAQTTPMRVQYYPPQSRYYES